MQVAGNQRFRFSRGNFDGHGYAFPSEKIPPFTDSATSPSGIDLRSIAGPDSPKRISFRYSPHSSGDKSFIQCKGQRIELGKTPDATRILHIVASSVDKDVFTNIKLVFQEPSTQSEDLLTFTVHKWDGPIPKGVQVAIETPFVRTPSGSVKGSFKLFHYTISIRDGRKLVAIGLPNEPNIRIAAVTLEK